MPGTLTFTLGVVTAPLVVGLRVAGTAVTGFTATARGMAGAASTAFRGITSSVSGVVSALHQINGAAQAVQGAISGLLGPVRLAAEIETARVQFRVLLGDVRQADEIFGKLSKLADDNPILDLGPVAEAAKMLAGTNIDKTGIPEFLGQLGQAATSNENFLRMVTAVTQMLGNGGKVSLEDLGQLRDAGMPTILTELPRVLNVTGEEFSDMMSKGQVSFDDLSQAIVNLTTGTGQYAGMASAAAQTTAGKWASVVTTVNQAQRAFGEKVIVALSPVLDKAVGLAGKLIPLAEAAGEKVRDVAMWLLAAFKSGRLGPLLWDGFKLAGLSLLDLLGRGFIALGARLKEVFTEAMLTLGDKLTLIMPAWLSNNENRQGALAREQARANGTYPRQKTLGEHFDEAKTGLEGRIGPLATSVAGHISAVTPYAKSLQEDVEYNQAVAGVKQGDAKPGNVIREVKPEKWNGILPTPNLYPDKPEPSPWLKKPWRPNEWQGPLPEGMAYRDMMGLYAADWAKTSGSSRGSMSQGSFPGLDNLRRLQSKGSPQPSFPGLDRLRNLQRGPLGITPASAPVPGTSTSPAASGPGSSGMPGMDLSGIGGAGTGGGGGGGAADPADPYGDKGRKNSEYSRAEKTLISGFNRQAKGRGRQSWDQWLNSSVRTAGVSPDRISALRGMDPEALSKVATNRPNRTRQEREKHAADMREKQQGGGADIGNTVRSIGGDVRQIKDHLSKLEVK